MQERSHRSGQAHGKHEYQQVEQHRGCRQTMRPTAHMDGYIELELSPEIFMTERAGQIAAGECMDRSRL